MADIDRDVKIKVKGDTKDFQRNVDAAGNKAQQFGDKSKLAGDKAKAGMEKAASGADKAKVGMGVAAIAVGQFASQIAGMATAVLDFESKVVALQKTMIGLEGQELALKRAQEDFNRAVAEGTITDLEFSRGLEDMELAYKNVRLEQANVAAETKKLDGEFVTFGISAVGAISQVMIAMIALGASKIYASITSGIGLIGKGLWKLAKHPVFLIITAGILAWELGLKSIVEDLTGIADLGIFSNIEKAFDGLSGSTNDLSELNAETKAFGDTVERNAPVFGSMADNIDNIGNSADRAAPKIDKLTVANERLIRSAGFSSGSGGGTLSDQINREADELDRATARTLAAASLHQALQNAGITGSVFSRNISGQLNDDGFKPANVKGGALGGLGGLATDLLNAGLTTPQIAKSLSKGAGKQSGAIGGFSGLTTSGSLSSSRGAGTGKRRSGRDRNPKGRSDKTSVRLANNFAPLFAKTHRQALQTLTGLRSNPGFKFKRFGNNSTLTRTEKRGIQEDAQLDRITERFREQSRIFGQMLAEEGIEEAGRVDAVDFLRLMVRPGAFKEIRGVIDFQKRNGLAVTGVTL